MVWCGVVLMAGRVAKDLAEIKTVSCFLISSKTEVHRQKQKSVYHWCLGSGEGHEMR